MKSRTWLILERSWSNWQIRSLDVASYTTGCRPATATHAHAALTLANTSLACQAPSSASALFFSLRLRCCSSLLCSYLLHTFRPPHLPINSSSSSSPAWSCLSPCSASPSPLSPPSYSEYYCQSSRASLAASPPEPLSLPTLLLPCPCRHLGVSVTLSPFLLLA